MSTDHQTQTQTHQSTLGHKIIHFLFHAPTEEDLGLPPAKEQLTKKQALEKIQEAWDHPLDPRHEERQKQFPKKENHHHEKPTTSHKTLGQKMVHFLFHGPTEKDLGLPASKEHLTKEQALEKIQEAWDHPLDPRHEEHKKREQQLAQQEKERHDSESKEHKSIGGKVSHLLFDAPTEKDIGLAPAKEHFTKDQALAKINEAWDHPFQHQPAAAPAHHA